MRPTANGAQRASRHHFSRFVAGMLVMFALVGLQFAATAPATAAVAPRVAIIVGPAGSQTAQNLAWGRAAAAEARHYTPNVVEVYTPRATWSRVKAATTGASIVVYIGRGRGFPSPLSSHLTKATEDGFGLNPRPDHGNSTTKYYGEGLVKYLDFAPNALVVLSHVPYASGSSASGGSAPNLSTVRLRVANYGAGFLLAGAAAVIADQYHAPTYYIRAVFTRDTSLENVWLAGPGHAGHVKKFTSARGHGAVGRVDPTKPTSGYYRSIVGNPATTTTAVRLGIPVQAPAPNPPVQNPGSSAMYGAAINADTKAQIQVGGTDTSSSNNRLAHRFQAGTTSAVLSVRFAQRGGSGYSAGSGGTMRISIQPDDGSGRPSSTILASANYSASNPGGNWTRFDKVTFPSPATLTKGRIYYVVFTNMNSAPRSNYISVNETFVYGSVLSPRQPMWSDADYGVLTTAGGSWAISGKYTADMDVAYANGWHDGDGYYQAQIEFYGVISGSSDMVRERFTVSGASRTISRVAVRMRRSGGSSPLVIRLETSSGALIDSLTIPASSVAASSPGGDNGGQVWVGGSFGTSHVLAKGTTYNLRLSTASGTTYTATPIREGSDIGFGSFVFSDGSAQRTTNGSSWADLYQYGRLDLQFYFR